MLSRSHANWAALAVIAGAAAIFAWDVSDAPAVDLVFIGPLLGVVLVLILLVAASELLRAHRAEPEQPEPTEIRNAGSEKRFAAFLALLVAFLIGFGTLGFFVSGVLFTPAAMWLLGARRPVELVVVPIVLLAALYALFVLLLEVRFPPSLIGMI